MQNRTIQEIVAREDWQKLRRSFLGTWMEYPETNCEKIQSWMGPVREAEMDQLIIVRNYLTGSGFRTGRISHPRIDWLLRLVREEIRRRRETQ